MKIKNVYKLDYFTAADGCKITETFGLPSEGVKDASVAYAILPPSHQTDSHFHMFLEWYIVTKGSGVMIINDEQKAVTIGDNILIPKENWHSIKNAGSEDLEFYCFCVPSFTLEGTVMKDGSEARESIERKF